MPFEQKELAKFSQAGRAIAQTVGASFETWAMGEATIIAKQWASHVPETTPERAVLRSRSRATIQAGVDTLKAFNVTVNTGRKGGEIGRVWFRTRRRKFQLAGKVSDSGSFDAANLHFKAEDAFGISMAAEGYARLLPRFIKAGQDAIGLARNSVLQILDSLGTAYENIKGGGGADLSSSDLSRARNAKPSNGQQYVNGFAIKEGHGDKFSVTLVNRYPRLVESGVDATLDQVVQQRVAYQMANFSSQVAKDTKALQQAYPYLEVD